MIRRFALALIPLTVLLLGAPLQAQLECTFEQLTDSQADNVVAFAGTSGDATRVVAAAFGDFGTGTNPDGSLELFAIDSGAGSATQITDSPGTHQLAFRNLSSDGKFAPFSTQLDITGGNPDGGWELYLLDLDTLHVTQLTSLPDAGFFTSPVISGDGSTVAVFATFDLTGENTDQSIEVFLIDLANSSIEQISDTLTSSGGTYSMAMNFDASVIALEAPGDYAGTNPNLFQQIYLWDGTFQQLTDYADNGSPPIQPTLSDSGGYLAFAAGLDPFGTNPDQNFEIFAFDTEAETLTQVTNDPNFSHWPSIDGTGQQLFFSSPGDHAGQNPSSIEQIFRYDLQTNIFGQVTIATTGSSSFLPLSSQDGQQVVFFSSQDFLGNNADNNLEIFRATCAEADSPVVDVPTLGQIGLVLLSLFLMTIALVFLCRYS